MSQRSYSLENNNLLNKQTPGICDSSNMRSLYKKQYSRRTEYNRRLSDEENLQRKIAAAAYMREYRARKKREQQGIYDSPYDGKNNKLLQKSKLVYMYNSEQHKAVIEEQTNPNENSASNELSICQPTDVNIKVEIEEESIKESSVEYISDDEQTINRFIKEPSVECIIADDDEILSASKIKLESPQSFAYEESLQEEPAPVQHFTEIPSTSSLPLNVINIKNKSRRKKVKDAQLKEIRKMHRNLLRESRRQTDLLRKIVKRMQQ